LSAAIAEEVGDRLWRQQLGHAFVRATRGSSRPTVTTPSVSTVICTRDRPEQLRACLESVMAVRTPPLEVIVVDSCPNDERTRALCDRYPVRYVREPVAGSSRARNRGIVEARGELVAFTDDDCIVDAGWLDGLGEPFADPLVMVVTGYVGPLELETRAQCIFQLYGSFHRSFERAVFDGLRIMDSGLGAGNAVIRRRALEEVGLFPEDLGPGTPALSGEDADLFNRVFRAGYRMVFEPRRIVWHAHRRAYREVRRAHFSYSVGIMAYLTRCVLGRHDLGGLRIAAWWWRHTLPRDLIRLLRRDELRVPLGLTLLRAAGTLIGPWRLLRSKLSARGRQPIELPPDAAPSPPRVIQAEDPPLSVAIASYNRRDRLARTLEGLGRQTFPPERYEVLVVLDGSSDGSAEMVRSLDVPYSLRLLEQENRGLAASRNRGGREASAPVVVWLDDDIVPEPAFLAEHAAAHRVAADEHVALGSYPPARQGPDTNLFSLANRQWWLDYFRRRADPDRPWTFVDFADGNVSFPRSLLLRSGGWDEDFQGGRRQDWEFGVRLLDQGVRFAYYPEARGWHYYSLSFSWAMKTRRVEGRNDVVFASKHPEVRSRLPLADIARSDGGELRTRRRFAYRHPELSARLVRPALPIVYALEHWKLRHRWRRMVSLVMSHAYILGMSDALPTLEDYRAFVAPVLEGEAVETLAVRLDEEGPLEMPRTVGDVRLALRHADERVAEVQAMELAEQWDWEGLTRRAIDESWRSYRDAVLCSGDGPPGAGAGAKLVMGLSR
jgi:GT2 family glycosyltransferase